MATVYVTMKGATLRFGDTEAEVDPPGTGAQDATCQITDAHIETTTTTETTAATLCADEVDAVTGVKRNLVITAFQDWSDPAGICWYLEAETLETKWFALALPSGGVHKGQVTIVPLTYGGPAGSNLTATATMPVMNHETTPPTPIAATAARKQTAKASA